MEQAPAQSIRQKITVAAIGRNPRATVLRIFVLVLACFVVFKFVLLPIRVDGISMFPTYRDNSVHLINRLAYISHPPRRGDVVGIRVGGRNVLGRMPSVMYMKRIIGLPGETVVFRRGQVFVNGQVLNEPYLRPGCNWNSPRIVDGTNQYFVVGDNRSMPWEYHEKGRIPAEQIVGDLLF